MGEQVKNGYELAVEDINAAGGVDVGGTKIPLELIVLDDESDPTKTVQQLEIQNSNGVVAYLGGAGSDLHAAAAGIAEKNQIAYLGIAFALQSVHEQGFKYLFSPFPKSRDHAKVTFDLLDSFAPKPAKVVIFQETTDWGAEMTRLWTAGSRQRAVAMRSPSTSTLPARPTISSLIMPARDAGAEVLLALPSSSGRTGHDEDRSRSWTWNAKVYFLIRAPDPPTFGENLGVDSDGVFLLPGWNNGLPYAGVAEMAAAYKAKYDKPAAALTGPAYSCVQILADAISRAGSLDRDGDPRRDRRDRIWTPWSATCSSRKTAGPRACSTRSTSGRVASRRLSSRPIVALVAPIYPAVPWSGPVSQ